jgi:serine phosphatase RsbU (regulator of sigma subunit)
MLGMTMLNEIVGNLGILKSNEILDRLREDIKRTLSQTGRIDEAKDGMDMSLVIINKTKKILEFSGAYNPLYLIRDNELIEYKGDKMPIGIHAGMESPFNKTEIKFRKNDIFYIFSDGYMDQFGEKTGKKLRARPFKKLLLEIHKNPLIKQKEILDEKIETWKGNLEQIDDMLVIGVKL